MTRRRRDPGGEGKVRDRLAITVGSVEFYPVPVRFTPEYDFTGEGEGYREVIEAALAGDRAANVKVLAALVRHVAEREPAPRVLLEYVAAAIQNAFTEEGASLDHAFHLTKRRASRAQLEPENDPFLWRLAERVETYYAVRRRQKEGVSREQAIADVAEACGKSESTVLRRVEWYLKIGRGRHVLFLDRPRRRRS